MAPRDPDIRPLAARVLGLPRHRRREQRLAWQVDLHVVRKTPGQRTFFDASHQLDRPCNRDTIVAAPRPGISIRLVKIIERLASLKLAPTFVTS